MEKQLVVFLLAVEAQLHQTQTAVLAPRGFQELVEALPCPYNSRIFTTGLLETTGFGRCSYLIFIFICFLSDHICVLLHHIYHTISCL